MDICCCGGPALVAKLNKQRYEDGKHFYELLAPMASGETKLWNIYGYRRQEWVLLI